MWQRGFSLIAAYSSSFLSLAITIWLVRIMPEADFALVALGLAVGTFTSLVVDLGTTRTFARDYIRLNKRSEQAALLHSNLGRRLLILLCLVAGAIPAAALGSDAPSRALALILFTSWATLRGMLPIAWYDTIGKTSLQNLLNLAERALTIACIGLVTWAHSEPPPLPLAIALFGSRLVGVVCQYLVWWLINPAGHRFRLAELSIAGAAGTNFSVTVAFSANAISSYGSQIVLRTHGSDIELAAYAVAFQLMSMVLLFQTQCLRLVMVSIAEACRSHRNLVRSVVRNVGIIGVTSAGLAVLAAICLHVMPHVLQREGYSMLPRFAVPLCTWVVVVGVGQVVTQHVLSLHHERHYLAVALCGGALASLLAFLLVPAYGALAAAYSLLAVNGFTVLANSFKLFQAIRRVDADSVLRRLPMSDESSSSDAAAA